MTGKDHRKRVKINALRLDRARGLLDTVHLQLTLLGDTAAAYRVNRIITNVRTEQQRWLQAADSPFP